MRYGRLQNEGAGDRMCQLQPISNSDSKIQNLQMCQKKLSTETDLQSKLKTSYLKINPMLLFQVKILKFEIRYKRLLLFIVNLTQRFSTFKRTKNLLLIKFCLYNSLFNENAWWFPKLMRIEQYGVYTYAERLFLKQKHLCQENTEGPWRCQENSVGPWRGI